MKDNLNNQKRPGRAAANQKEPDFVIWESESEKYFEFKSFSNTDDCMLSIEDPDPRSL